LEAKDVIMGQTQTAPVPMAQSPVPMAIPVMPTLQALEAPRRGVRIARSRAELPPGAALDAAVLEAVMGWEWRQLERPDGPPLRLLWNPKWGPPRGAEDVRVVNDGRADRSNGESGSEGGRALPWDAPRPSTDAVAVAEMEAEVERRGLQYPYVVALTAIVAHTKSAQQGWQNGWHLLRATPAQRCHAALRAAGYGPRC
jgi:hypothetical protein